MNNKTIEVQSEEQGLSALDIIMGIAAGILVARLIEFIFLALIYAIFK